MFTSKLRNTSLLLNGKYWFTVSYAVDIVRRSGFSLLSLSCTTHACSFGATTSHNWYRSWLVGVEQAPSWCQEEEAMMWYMRRLNMRNRRTLTSLPVPISEIWPRWRGVWQIDVGSVSRSLSVRQAYDLNLVSCRDYRNRKLSEHLKRCLPINSSTVGGQDPWN